MLTFPMHNAALDLKGKSPEELPHGLLTVPPEIRELVEEERAKMRPEAFDYNKEDFLNRWTVDWYFDGLGYEVMYRPSPDGPEVLAVGSDETFALKKAAPLEKRPDVKTYLGY